MTPLSLLIATSMMTTLLLLHLSPSPTMAVIPSAFIFDEDGEPMINGGTYYIIPRGTGSDGGLTVAPTTPGAEPCPIFLTQEKDSTSNGIPFKISSHINSKYLVYGTIDFTLVGVTTTCTKPLVWRLATNDATGQLYVAAGTNDWHEPSAFNIIGSFNYNPKEPYQCRINFCNESVCKDATILEDNGLLGLSPYATNAVNFRKASLGSFSTI